MDGLGVGRVVHYVELGECRAAIVAKIWTPEGLVNLGAWEGNGLGVPRTSVVHDEEKADGTWHWPERA